ncbi:hypothetical protein TPL01_31250 [Sulfuriferula plumbiphila]|uniref:RND efflux pump membrane fusion protein barrel-sandwich domain-containing protein n=1 Tax=Sulfuriferula plumbiphila TaxID=171865 RepID=A0A512LBX9_9PROT|nr:hypothetical protein [Sulfuriferula plumbiphila]BBP05406.1 hypothetical protein SFPGR_28280 [Sulfuriferula plumbiphila]GEP31987.1 hypothetical protein TPL01_31250 [Sulfuriferula plumbiphila]
MNKKKVLIAGAVVTVLLLGAVALVRHQHKVLASAPRPQNWATVINARTLDISDVRLTRPAVADVQALQQAVFASRLSGYVKRMPLFEAGAFKRGEVLVEIDRADAQAGLLRSQSDLARIELDSGTLHSALAAAQADTSAARQRLERAQALYKIQGISLQSLQAEQAATAAAEARLRGARAALDGYHKVRIAAKSAAASAQANLAYAVMRAPFDGVVAARLVQPGDLATPGRPLLRIVALGQQRVLVDTADNVPLVALRLGGRDYPVRPWPEATAQGQRRWEARVDGLMPGAKVAVDLVTFSGSGVFLPGQCMLNNDGRRAAVIRLPADGRGPAQAQSVNLLASGVEGAAARPTGLVGAHIACASQDVLNRLAGGTPYRIAGKN